MDDTMNEFMDKTHDEVGILLKKQIEAAFDTDNPADYLIALSSVYLVNALRMADEALGPEQSTMWVREIIEERIDLTDSEEISATIH